MLWPIASDLLVVHQQLKIIRKPVVITVPAHGIQSKLPFFIVAEAIEIVVPAATDEDNLVRQPRRTGHKELPRTGDGVSRPNRVVFRFLIVGEPITNRAKRVDELNRFCGVFESALHTIQQDDGTSLKVSITLFAEGIEFFIFVIKDFPTAEVDGGFTEVDEFDVFASARISILAFDYAG